MGGLMTVELLKSKLTSEINNPQKKLITVPLHGSILIFGIIV